MKRYLMIISYDGTNFCGWQSQKKGRTVQQTLEKALTVIAKESVPIVGSGRTDAGVHALKQFAHFDFPVTMTPKQILLALNSKLPNDIRVLKIVQVKNDFNARYDATSRKYIYLITKERTPFNRFYKSFFPRIKIVPKKIINCLSYFEGKHDFTSFSKFNPDISSQICDVQNFFFKQEKDEFMFEISANRFLHHMVKRIVGTVLKISDSNQKPEIILELFYQKNPMNKLITTASPEGLYLADVIYKS